MIRMELQLVFSRSISLGNAARPKSDLSTYFVALDDDACAGSVLTPYDDITNVQKRLGNRAWTGFGECRLCGSFFGPTVGTWRNLQHRRSHAVTQRVRSRCGVWSETRGPSHHHGAQRAHSIANQAG